MPIMSNFAPSDQGTKLPHCKISLQNDEHVIFTLKIAPQGGAISKKKTQRNQPQCHTSGSEAAEDGESVPGADRDQHLPLEA